MLLGSRGRRLEGGVDGVRFWRGRQIDAGLGKRELALGRAQIVVGVLGRVGDDQRLRDRQARCPPPPCAPAAGRDKAGPRRRRTCAQDSRGRRRGPSRAPICAAPRSDCSGRPGSCRRPARGAGRCPATLRRRRSRRGCAARHTSSASVSAARPSPSLIRSSTARASGIERQRPPFRALGALQQLLDGSLRPACGRSAPVPATAAPR